MNRPREVSELSDAQTPTSIARMATDTELARLNTRMSTAMPNDELTSDANARRALAHRLGCNATDLANYGLMTAESIVSGRPNNARAVLDDVAITRTIAVQVVNGDLAPLPVMGMVEYWVATWPNDAPPSTEDVKLLALAASLFASLVLRLTVLNVKVAYKKANVKVVTGHLPPLPEELVAVVEKSNSVNAEVCGRSVGLGVLGSLISAATGTPMPVDSEMAKEPVRTTFYLLGFGRMDRHIVRLVMGPLCSLSSATFADIGTSQRMSAEMIRVNLHNLAIRIPIRPVESTAFMVCSNLIKSVLFHPKADKVVDLVDAHRDEVVVNNCHDDILRFHRGQASIATEAALTMATTICPLIAQYAAIYAAFISPDHPNPLSLLSSETARRCSSLMSAPPTHRAAENHPALITVTYRKACERLALFDPASNENTRPTSTTISKCVRKELQENREKFGRLAASGCSEAGGNSMPSIDSSTNCSSSSNEIGLTTCLTSTSSGDSRDDHMDMGGSIGDGVIKVSGNSPDLDTAADILAADISLELSELVGTMTSLVADGKYQQAIDEWVNAPATLKDTTFKADYQQGLDIFTKAIAMPRATAKRSITTSQESDHRSGAAAVTSIRSHPSAPANTDSGTSPDKVTSPAATTL